ncbi:MAG: class I SAM-dependent methyltransferase [Candidatus Limnocylindrales bacterium]|jgi:ubiquinone/menaquinone biosynthesis C-methylase UbiE
MGKIRKLALAGAMGIGVVAIWRAVRFRGSAPDLDGEFGSRLSSDLAECLCLPGTHEPVTAAGATRDGTAADLVSQSSRRRVPIRNGVADFLKPGELTGPDAVWERRYDRWAPFYDLATQTWARLRSGGDERRVREYLDLLAIEPGQLVLEVSVGTGRNLHYLPTDAKYLGLDISMGMLARCQRNLRRWGRRALLVRGTAERLPFRDACFDVVFHVGGINFFSDPRAAVDEMVRVAKPGTQILIVDETDKVARAYRRPEAPAASPSVRPIDLVPPHMLELRLREIAKGELYCLTFRTPRTAD